MPEDNQLLLNYARRGDVNSLSALVVRSTPWLLAYLRGMMSCDQDAEDAFQECWMRVIKSCHSYRGGVVRSYLLRIARSVVIDRYRRQGVPAISLDGAGDEDGMVETLADAKPTPAEMFESSSNSEMVRQAVKTLPMKKREVLLLRIEGELSFKEIAEQLNIPLGTALTWMHAATIQLKKMLGEKT